MVGFGTDSFLVGPRKKMFPPNSVAKKMEMVICFGNVLFLRYCMLESSWSFQALCLWIVVSGHGACSGMAGCLVSAAAVTRAPWAASVGQLACLKLEGCLVLIRVDLSSCWAPPDYWDAADTALEMSDYPNIWTDGSREYFSSVGGFEVAGAGVYLPAAEVAFECAVWGVAEGYGDARLERCVLLCLFLVFCRQSSVLTRSAYG